jgi:flagellar assembly protein FliH
LQQSRSATNDGNPARLEVFQYPAGPDLAFSPPWVGWEEPAAPAPSDPEPDLQDRRKTEAEAAARAEFEKRLAEEGRTAFEAGREQGRQEGRLAERESQAQAVGLAAQQRIRQAAELLEGFSRESDRFLQRVEHEVVELALAIAARILRREAQMDPLLLTGAVRVALGQLSSTTAVRLRVPAAELDMWTESIALIPNLAIKPMVISGEGMRLGDCAIETELGSVDLGIRSQLGEIERGFFDRAGGPGARRPAATVDGGSGAAAEIHA